MKRDSLQHSIISDLLAGLAAIVLIVGTSIRASFVGSDLRVLVAVSSLGFLAAGLVRGRGGIANVWLKGVVVSSPGLLGTAALIMNDGLHRLPIPILMTVTGILFATAGVQVRRWWSASRRRSLLLAFLSAAGLVVSAALVAPAVVTFASVKREDRMAPPIELSRMDGGTFDPAELRGHVVLLAFWASWCLPCTWELPELETAQASFKDDQRVTFLAVDVGWGRETAARGKYYLTARKLNLPAAFDSGSVATSLGVDALPTLVLIDSHNRIRMVHHGYDASEHVATLLQRRIRRLLEERPS